MIDAAAPKAARELFAQLNGPCPISPPKPERHDAGSAGWGGGRGWGGACCGVAQPHRQTATGSISRAGRGGRARILRFNVLKDRRGTCSLPTHEVFCY